MGFRKEWFNTPLQISRRHQAYGRHGYATGHSNCSPIALKRLVLPNPLPPNSNTTSPFQQYKLAPFAAQSCLAACATNKSFTAISSASNVAA
eukprot:1513779-Ditylum_brightwellii.AAC.1